LTPGGLWDSSKYDIRAMVKFDGKIIETVPLSFTGPSMFAGQAAVSEKGSYEIIVYAFDPQTGNTGADSVSIDVGP
jgi:hypothetical protein